VSFGLHESSEIHIHDPRLNRYFKRTEKAERVPQTIDKNVYTSKRLQVPEVLFLALRKSPLEYKTWSYRVIKGNVMCAPMPLMTHSILENHVSRSWA